VIIDTNVIYKPYIQNGDYQLSKSPPWQVNSPLKTDIFITCISLKNKLRKANIVFYTWQSFLGYLSHLSIILTQE